jgi:hypothetical protein
MLHMAAIRDFNTGYQLHCSGVFHKLGNLDFYQSSSSSSSSTTWYHSRGLSYSIKLGQWLQLENGTNNLANVNSLIQCVCVCCKGDGLLLRERYVMIWSPFWRLGKPPDLQIFNLCGKYTHSQIFFNSTTTLSGFKSPSPLHRTQASDSMDSFEAGEPSFGFSNPPPSPGICNPQSGPRDPSFSMLSAMIGHPEICLEFASRLTPDTLCDLYSISKEFHYIMNSSYFVYIKTSAELWAPNAFETFPFQSLKSLCVSDPSFNPLQRDVDVARTIPGLKWLKMARFRHGVINMILYKLDQAGHRLPADAHKVLQKLWFTMRIPSNAHRIGIIHNSNYWSNTDLFIAVMFFIKIDMALTDPMEGQGETQLRQLMIAQKGLLPLCELLWHRLSALDLVRMQVAYKYTPRVPQNLNLSIFGIPPARIGRGWLEGFGTGPAVAHRIDQLVMRETIHRRMHVNKWFLDIVLYGYQEAANNITDMVPKEEAGPMWYWPRPWLLKSWITMPAQVFITGRLGVAEEQMKGQLRHNRLGMIRARLRHGHLTKERAVEIANMVKDGTIDEETCLLMMLGRDAVVQERLDREREAREQLAMEVD